MRMLIGELNRTVNRLPDGAESIGGKSDHVLILIEDLDAGSEVLIEVLELTATGETHVIASNRPGAAGPPLEFSLIRDEGNRRTYLLRLLYVSLPGHLIRCWSGESSAEAAVWSAGGYAIEEQTNLDRRNGWYVTDLQVTDARIEQATTDPYSLGQCGVIGPYRSKSEAEKFLLMFALESLSEAVLQNDRVEEWRDRAADALLAVKL